MDSPRAPQHLLSPNSLIRYKTFEGTHSCQGIQSWYSRRDQPKSVFDNNARSVWARKPFDGLGHQGSARRVGSEPANPLGYRSL
jgi:hypothetical protein